MENPAASSTHPKQDLENQFFLPVSLTKIVMKIAKAFKFSSYDEFSLLDTLQFVLSKNIEMEINDEKGMTIFLLNVVRISEKFNTAEMVMSKLETIFPQLGISSEEFNRVEFKIFETIDFHVQPPAVVELLYNLIEEKLGDLKRKDFVFEFSLDILRIVYSARSFIYET